MNAIARFSKVSYEQFYEDYVKTQIKAYQDAFATDESDDKFHSIVGRVYHNITLPNRSTIGSAGYDFITPIHIILNPGHSVVIPTGIRVQIDDGYVMTVYPRSSVGFKYGIRLANTVGIIDSDYYNSDNEGHIMIKLTNDSNKQVSIGQYERFVQGLFLPYGIAANDDVTNVRIGGIGSTGKF